MTKSEIIRKSILALGLGASVATGYEVLYDIKPAPRIEIIELRAEHSKTYALPDLLNGKPHQVSVFVEEPLHYQDAQGKWQNIETDFLAVGTSTFKNSANRFNVYIPKTFGEPQFSCLSGKCVYWLPQNANPAQVSFRTDSTSTYFRERKTDIATYKDAWQGTDVEYHNEWYGMKEKIIVKDVSAPKTFTFDFTTQGLSKKLYKNALKFADENGDVIFLEEITAFDAMKRQVPITTSRIGNAFTLSYNPAGFVYPIIIDPVSNFNPPSGNADGGVLDTASNTWEAMRTGAGTAANLVETNESGRIRENAAGTFLFTNQISWAFDTGITIPATATINNTASTSLSLFINDALETCVINDNDTEAYFSVVKHLRAATSTISTSDYKKFLMSDNTEIVVADLGLKTGSGSTTISSLNAMNANAWHNFILDTTGITWIGKGSIAGINATTTLALLEGHYIEDKAITLAAGKENSCNFQMVENTNDPLLEVDWSSASVQTPQEDVIFFSKKNIKEIVRTFSKKLIQYVYAKE